MSARTEWALTGVAGVAYLAVHFLYGALRMGWI